MGHDARDRGDMPTLNQDLEFQQGITFKFIVEVVGGPTSLIGCTAAMQVRPFRTSDEILVDLSTAIDGGLTIDDDARQITILIDEDETRLFDWNSPAVYDLELDDGTPNGPWRVMAGLVKLSREVTR